MQTRTEQANACEDTPVLQAGLGGLDSAQVGHLRAEDCHDHFSPGDAL